MSPQSQFCYSASISWLSRQTNQILPQSPPIPFFLSNFRSVVTWLFQPSLQLELISLHSWGNDSSSLFIWRKTGFETCLRTWPQTSLRFMFHMYIFSAWGEHNLKSYTVYKSPNIPSDNEPEPAWSKFHSNPSHLHYHAAHLQWGGGYPRPARQSTKA